MGTSKLGPQSQPNEDWDEWLRYLKRRKQPNLASLAGAPKSPPLLWARPVQASPADELCVQIHRLMGDEKRTKTQTAALGEKLHAWCDQALSHDWDLAFAYESLAWTYFIPDLARHTSQADWNRLLESLCDLAETGLAAYLDGRLTSQLYAGELPHALASVLPELERCEVLADSARRSMSTTLVEMMDGEGLPHIRSLPHFRPYLASLTRCKLHAKTGQPPLADEAELQFEWSVTQALRLCRFDGSQVFGRDGEAPWDADFFVALLDVARDAKDDDAARLSLPRGKKLWPETKASISKNGSKTKAKSSNLREPSVYSEWSEFAILRNNWTKNSPQWALTFDAPVMRTELTASRTRIWGGDWPIELSIEGEIREADGKWEENCWYDDDDVNYLELEMDYGDGWRLQRQILLAIPDEFLFVADAILGDAQVEIEYMSRLPLVESVACRPRDETNDAVLSQGGKPVAIVMPLAFPEWRNEHPPGELRNTLDGLQLRQSARGESLYAPLFIDLRKSRLKQEPTWRRLTVASRLETQPLDRAVAYRVQVGAKQWVIYRSLSEPANRTFLGQNVVSEFFCGRFLRNGDTETIIEVD